MSASEPIVLHQAELHDAMPLQSETLLPTYQVRDLLQGAQEVGLLLDGVLYRLRLTRQGKLIMTK